MRIIKTAFIGVIIVMQLSAHLYQEPVSARVGAPFTIKLSGLPSRRVRWSLLNAADIKEYVEQGNEQFIADRYTVPGRDGMQLFHFKPLKAGTISMKFSQKSASDKRTIADIIITVIIKRAP